MKFKLILASVKPEKSNAVVDAAKGAGATGATVITARGTGIHEAKTFFGLVLEARSDIILFLVEENLAGKILAAIGEAGEFHKPGTGIAFVLPVDRVVGLESQMERFREDVRDLYF